MKTTFLSLLLILMFAAFANAQKCDCTKIPFKPEPDCFNFCATNLLSRLDSWELRVVFSLSKESAEGVERTRFTRIPNQPPPSVEEAYIGVVSDEELANLVKKIRELTKEQVRFLQKSPEERKGLRNEKQFKDIFALDDKTIKLRGSG